MDNSFIPDSQFKADVPDIATHEAPQSGFIPDNQFKPDQPMDAAAQADAAQAKDDALQSQYGTGSQQAIAGVEALAKGVAGPLATLGETKVLGVKPEDIKGREEANPVTHAAGEIGGLMLPVGQGALLGKAGEHLVSGIVGKGALKGIAKTAVKVGAENALYQAGDETSKMILHDPQQSIGSAISNIGLAAVIGGVTGGALGSVSPLWKASVGNKASQFIEDFKGRFNEHLNNPNPVETFTNELSQYHKNITDMADEVYGPQGLKNEAIQKLMPEMSDKISNQMSELNDKAEKTFRDMADKQVPERYLKKFQNDLQQFQDVATRPGANPSELFSAAQDFKQTLQGYSKGNFGPFAVPSYHEAYDFLNHTKGLAKDLRTSLESPEVWGKAADRQQAINKAFSEYKPALDDFNKKFTTEVAGERVIDPGKAATYVNQLGKSSAEIKQTMLDNFVKASEKYKKVIGDTHSALGVENPMQQSSLSAINNTLKEVTPGMHLADVLVKKSLADVGGHALGAGIGEAVGHASGIPFGGTLGFFAGEHALGPIFKGILPALIKPMLEKASNSEGLKAALDYGMQVHKGNKLADQAVKAIFAGGKVIPSEKLTTKEQREKLDTALQKYQQDPTALADNSGVVSHYLADHAAALGGVTSTAVQYLNSLRPQPQQRGMLDPKLKANPVAQAQFNQALDIANQPLTVLQKINDGTLTSKDVTTLRTIYPNLYQGLSQKIMNQMVDLTEKEDAVPYQTRIGTSLFLGQGLDSTMQPQAILLAQPTPQQGPQGPPGAQGGNPGGAKGSPKAIGKETNKLAMTGVQNGAAIAAGAKKA